MQAELVAIVKGLQFATFNHPNVEVESNCAVHLDLINCKAASHMLDHELQQIYRLVPFFISCKFSFTFRECNKSAHWVANYARWSKTTNVWPSTRPPELSSILYQDLHGPPFIH
ncbi:hypothetical protein Cni_G19380 [Canna indica]|uniref:RNase H type-1 domain-containing protein n=1 Tax=Canna indica TaxID=4628 RepID=A0AAQ3QIG9_9LILI|nr:hypothetical protein Cni_G19380 [Canna indica]